MTDTSEGNEHPLYELVGMLDEEEAERVRSRCEGFRDDVSEEVSGTSED